MQDANIQYYIDKLEEEDSFFSLIEAGESILPLLEAQFKHEASPERREIIVRIIREFHTSISLAFFTHALCDPAPAVWQEALNGIVTIGGKKAITVLRMSLPAAPPVKQEWICEAIEQLLNENRKGGR